MGETVELKAADGHTFSAYRADPGRKPAGGIVVIQESFGVNAHIRGHYDAFAATLARRRTLAFFTATLG